MRPHWMSLTSAQDGPSSAEETPSSTKESFLKETFIDETLHKETAGKRHQRAKCGNLQVKALRRMVSNERARSWYAIDESTLWAVGPCSELPCTSTSIRLFLAHRSG